MLFTKYIFRTTTTLLLSVLLIVLQSTAAQGGAMEEARETMEVLQSRSFSSVKEAEGKRESLDSTTEAIHFSHAPFIGHNQSYDRVSSTPLYILYCQLLLDGCEVFITGTADQKMDLPPKLLK